MCYLCGGEVRLLNVALSVLQVVSHVPRHFSFLDSLALLGHQEPRELLHTHDASLAIALQPLVENLQHNIGRCVELSTYKLVKAFNR